MDSELERLQARNTALERENEALKKSLAVLNVRAGSGAVFDPSSPVPAVESPDVRVHPSTTDTPNKTDFVCRDTLRDHRGAIYALAASGTLLACAGLDGIRLWKDGLLSASPRLHSGPVADVAFSSDGSHLLSGGYDARVCVMHVETQDVLFSAASPSGLVQSVAWYPLDPALFLFGTSRKAFCIADTRSPGAPITTIANDAMVYSVCPFANEPYAYLGDASGAVKTVDLRANSILPSTIQTSSNGNTKSPAIAHLALSSANQSSPSLLASTSFDNSIRIYKRPQAVDNPPEPFLSLQGRNRNWPIRCAWSSHSSEQLLLAAGSSDANVLLYDLSSPSPQASLRTLPGHTAEVYAVAFAQSSSGQSLLASAGADQVIRLWSR